MRLARFLDPRRMARDDGGATLPEFAIILPTFLVLLFGIFDIGQAVYAQAVLQGAMQDAGRDAGLEGNATNEQMAKIDQYIRDQTGPVVFTNPVYSISRVNYKSFSDVGREEEGEDTNKNGVYDPGVDCYYEENGFAGRQDDVGKDGVGGANDVAVYTATVEYDRVFPLWKLIGGSDKTTLSATTTLRNQPYGPQAARGKTLTCPPKSK